MKKIITIVTLSTCLILTGCDNSKTESSVNTGNITAKIESLSYQNNDDIKIDLVSLNSIINSSNTKAEQLRNELTEAGRDGNKSEIKNILEKSKALLESTNQSLLNLTLKSKEVQEIRVGIYQGNMLSIESINLYFKENKTKEDNQELTQLQRKSMALQQAIGAKLDKLNIEYNVQ